MADPALLVLDAVSHDEHVQRAVPAAATAADSTAYSQPTGLKPRRASLVLEATANLMNDLADHNQRSSALMDELEKLLKSSSALSNQQPAAAQPAVKTDDEEVPFAPEPEPDVKWSEESYDMPQQPGPAALNIPPASPPPAARQLRRMSSVVLDANGLNTAANNMAAVQASLSFSGGALPARSRSVSRRASFYVPPSAHSMSGGTQGLASPSPTLSPCPPPFARQGSFNGSSRRSSSVALGYPSLPNDIACGPISPSAGAGAMGMPMGLPSPDCLHGPISAGGMVSPGGGSALSSRQPSFNRRSSLLDSMSTHGQPSGRGIGHSTSYNRSRSGHLGGLPSVGGGGSGGHSSFGVGAGASLAGHGGFSRASTGCYNTDHGLLGGGGDPSTRCRDEDRPPTAVTPNRSPSGEALNGMIFQEVGMLRSYDDDDEDDEYDRGDGGDSDGGIRDAAGVGRPFGAAGPGGLGLEEACDDSGKGKQANSGRFKKLMSKLFKNMVDSTNQSKQSQQPSAREKGVIHGSSEALRGALTCDPPAGPPLRGSNPGKAPTFGTSSLHGASGDGLLLPVGGSISLPGGATCNSSLMTNAAHAPAGRTLSTMRSTSITRGTNDGTATAANAMATIAAARPHLQPLPPAGRATVVNPAFARVSAPPGPHHSVSAPPGPHHSVSFSAAAVSATGGRRRSGLMPAPLSPGVGGAAGASNLLATATH